MEIETLMQAGNLLLTMGVAYGVFRLNSKFDTLKGRVDELSAGHRDLVSALVPAAFAGERRTQRGASPSS